MTLVGRGHRSADMLGYQFHRIHIHLSVEEVGAPRLAALSSAPSPVQVTTGTPFAVSDDRIEKAAREKFAADGWILIENEQFDLDITYDGESYIVEGWVR